MSADFDATVARVKPGDEVTATFRLVHDATETFVVSGTTWVTDIGSLAVGYEVVRFTDGLPGPDLRGLVIKKPASDPEPPAGSVVLDTDNEAWQLLPSVSTGTVFWVSAADNTRLSWHQLGHVCGPLRVIYTPEVES